MILTADYLDKMRCATCGRTIAECGDEMYLNAACHPHKPKMVTARGEDNRLLRVACAICGKLIALFAVQEPVEIHVAPCHPWQYYEAKYQAGQIVLSCAVCNQELARYPVARAEGKTND